PLRVHGRTYRHRRFRGARRERVRVAIELNMPAAPRASAVYHVTLGTRDRTPRVRGWNRLEGRPRSADFARSLRAAVRDPIWFLTRQWQYGEFEGDDAGSPIDAR